MNNSLSKEIESLCVLKQDDQDIPLWPYVVAVSGHRTFAKPGEVEGLPGYELETIKKTFKKELEDLASLWKESCNGVNAPLILLTGMAEGADQLVVEAARKLIEKAMVIYKRLAELIPDNPKTQKELVMLQMLLAQFQN